jgi:hypothetical protein
MEILFPVQGKDARLRPSKFKPLGSLQKYSSNIFEEKTCIACSHLIFVPEKASRIEGNYTERKVLIVFSGKKIYVFL